MVKQWVKDAKNYQSKWAKKHNCLLKIKTKLPKFSVIKIYDVGSWYNHSLTWYFYLEQSRASSSLPSTNTLFFIKNFMRLFWKHHLSRCIAVIFDVSICLSHTSKQFYSLKLGGQRRWAGCLQMKMIHYRRAILWITKLLWFEGNTPCVCVAILEPSNK